MDGDWIDRLSRLLITAPDRRHALQALAGIALVGLTSSLRLDALGARRGKKKKKKGGRKKRCIANSIPFIEPSAICSSSAQCCDKGTCCDSGEGSHCFDLNTDPTFCGSNCEEFVNCGNLPGTPQCVNGQCANIT